MRDETNNARATPIGEVLYQHIYSNAQQYTKLHKQTTNVSTNLCIPFFF